MVAGIVAGMSAARATLVSATIDTVASKNFFIIPTPIFDPSGDKIPSVFVAIPFSQRVT